MTSSKLIQVSINYGGHDTSSALSIGNKIVAAAEQERYDLSKHSRNFPIDALKSCLKKFKLKISDVDHFILTTDFKTAIKEFYLKPALNDDTVLNKLFEENEKIKKFINIENEIRKKLSFNGEFTTVVVLKSGTTYFPLSCIDGSDISNSTAISLMKFFK